MAYLNDIEVEQGGATRFFSVIPPPGAVAFDSTPHKDVQPKLGRVVIFDHRIFHEGIEFHGDVKHILRSDVLFKLSSASDYRSYTSTHTSTAADADMRTPERRHQRAKE